MWKTACREKYEDFHKDEVPVILQFILAEEPVTYPAQITAHWVMDLIFSKDKEKRY